MSGFAVIVDGRSVRVSGGIYEETFCGKILPKGKLWVIVDDHIDGRAFPSEMAAALTLAAEYVTLNDKCLTEEKDAATSACKVHASGPVE